MDYLSDLERELVEAFFSNETQREAVRKVLLAGVYSNGTLKVGEKANPTRNWALALALNADYDKISNETLGANLRAVSEGIRVVELAFDELSKIHKDDKITKKSNPAR